MDKSKINWKEKAEEIIEQKNGIIQILLFFLLLIFSGLFALGIQSTTAIIIELLGIISLEVITINIKDSIVHRKLNRLGVRIEMEDGALFRVSDFDINPFFSNAHNHVFVSGIALNYFIQTFDNEIVQLLRDGKKLYILIIAPELIEESSKLYYGVEKTEDKASARVSDIIRKQLMTLNHIKNSDELFSHFERGDIELRIALNMISTSFVAYDVLFNTLGVHKEGVLYREIKALFYQYKCTIGRNEPNIIVNSKDNKDWYNFFKDTIEAQWNDSMAIISKVEYEKLIDDLNNISLHFSTKK